MKFLADENIPAFVCQTLKIQGVDIFNINDIECGMSDKDIANFAKKQERIIITFDKDFGELVFKDQLDVKGIILLRFKPKNPHFILEKIKNLFNNTEIKLQNNFIIVEEDRIRIRKIK